MEITLISDTHGSHKELGELSGDVLIHCGDLAESFDSDGSSVADLDEWFSRQQFDQILYIGGNHDFWLQKQLEQTSQPYLHGRCVHDEAFEFGGLTFYGAPWTPFMPGFAFYLEGDALRKKWAMIPQGVDVLITHTPPFGIMDKPHGDYPHVGCPYLLERVLEVKPKIHCFGHVHAGYGREELGGTVFVNAALVNGQNRIKHNPIEIRI